MDSSRFAWTNGTDFCEAQAQSREHYANLQDELFQILNEGILSAYRHLDQASALS